MNKQHGMKIYTSYYTKIASMHKSNRDIYIQVSNTVFCPRKNKDGVLIANLIDLNLGEVFGMKSDSLEQYRQDITDSDIDYLYNVLKDIKKDMYNKFNIVDFNVFLLCHENINRKYTKKDVEKSWCTDIKEGDYKICHRIVLAELLNNKYNLGITEYTD